MLLDVLLDINKNKLESMILGDAQYQEIVNQSQKLDKYVQDKFLLMNPT